MTAYTADSLIRMLRDKYPSPQYAFVEQVPDATSLNKTRSADAIAMGCWKTVQIHMHGFEIKVSRGDWLRELQDRSKSAPFEKHCHHWWIVAPPKIVKLEELPSEWGLMEPTKAGLRVKSAASLRTPEPVSWNFLAALLRQAVKSTLDDRKIDSIRAQARRDAMDEAERRYKDDRKDKSLLTAYERRAENAEAAIRRFQEQSGLLLQEWTAGNVGETVALLMRLRGNGVDRALENMQKTAAGISAEADALRTLLSKEVCREESPCT